MPSKPICASRIVIPLVASLASVLCAIACSGRLETGAVVVDASASASDTDGDGISDSAEGRYVSGGAVDSDGDGTPDYQDTDSDNDGIEDAIEGDGDFDGDGIPNFRDEDSDNDGLPDSVEGAPDQPDTDGDGKRDYLDTDSDGDGIGDRVESDGANPVDTDGDGIPDYRDLDTDADGLLDADEGVEDWDADGIANFRDPFNDGLPSAITLTAISTAFNKPIGIDYHEPTNSVVITVNYPNGDPLNFERIDANGDHHAFSSLSGMGDEIKIATARSGNPAGFPAGDLFVGNGIDGQIVRITDGGDTVISPWVDLPGDANGLIRGSLYVDRTNVFGGDLIVVTTLGQVWRISAAAVPTKIADTGVHLEGMIVVPNVPVRYGPLAGKIIAGSETEGLLYAFSVSGETSTFELGVNIEDIDLISDRENFFGVNYGTSQLLGAPATQFQELVGDILLIQEGVGATGMFRLQWNGTTLLAQEIPITADSAVPGQWEHVTFAPAGIVEIPPID